MYIEYLASSGLVVVENVEEKISITIPRLADWADDYVRKVRSKSDKSPENVRLEQSRAEQSKTEESRSEQKNAQAVASLADVFSSSSAHSPRPEQSLAEKVDELMSSEGAKEFFRDEGGGVSTYKLARLINQRDQKANAEPTDKMLRAVTSCVRASRSISKMGEL